LEEMGFRPFRFGKLFFMSQALKPKGVIGNGLSKFWLLF
jgi:hypothetical protein